MVPILALEVRDDFSGMPSGLFPKPRSREAERDLYHLRTPRSFGSTQLSGVAVIWIPPASFVGIPEKATREIAANTRVGEI